LKNIRVGNTVNKFFIKSGGMVQAPLTDHSFCMSINVAPGNRHAGKKKLSIHEQQKTRRWHALAPVVQHSVLKRFFSFLSFVRKKKFLEDAK
jgi:hypothetical protein